MGEEQNSDFALDPKPERSDQLPEDAPKEQVSEDSGDGDDEEDPQTGQREQGGAS